MSRKEIVLRCQCTSLLTLHSLYIVCSLMAAVVFRVSAGWLEYMWLLCVSRVTGVARGMVGRCMHFSRVDGRQIVP